MNETMLQKLVAKCQAICAVFVYAIIFVFVAAVT